MDETARGIAVAGLILGAMGFAVSILSLGVSFWVARRDSASVRVEASLGQVTGPLLLASPQLTVWDVSHRPLVMIDVVNAGRRPVTTNVAGFRLRTTGIWRLVFREWDRTRPDRLAWVTTTESLPARLEEQSGIKFFSTLEDAQRELGRVLRSPHQIAGVYADDVTGRRHTQGLTRKVWRALVADVEFDGTDAK